VTEASRTVLFVCAHGAYRSRLAAAFFNAAAPTGWRAASAGQEPQDAVSDAAIRLAAGTAAEAHLEQDRPHALAQHRSPDRLVAIDCDVPGAERWNLTVTQIGRAQRDEIRARAERLASELQPRG
jgi:protein-tyrosine-phosphatase